MRILMRGRLGPLLVAVLLAGCAKPAPVAPVVEQEPSTIEATVITLRSVTRPDETVRRHELIVAGGKIRSTDEIDSWRLFDVDAKTVTFIDDIAETAHTRTLDAMLEERSRLIAAAPAVPAVAAVERDTRAEEIIDGYPAHRLLIRLGAFQRELWITDALPVDPDFFALYNAAEPFDPDGVSAMRDVIHALAETRGFPVADHIRFDWGDHSIEIETHVESVATRTIPANWLRAPAGYRDDSVTESAVDRPSGGSRPLDPDAREAESQSSGTDQNTP